MRNKIVVMVLAAAVSIGFAAISVMTQAPPQQPLGIEKVKEGLYIITGSGGNVAVRITTEGVILVDDKFEQNFNEIMEKVKSVTSQPVKYVLSTHHHGDHVGGNAGFIRIAEIIAHQNARANMIKGNQAAPPRIVFSDKTAVHLGEAEVQAHHLGRGHTNGDAVIYFPDLKVVHTGDLFVGSTPFIDYANGGSSIEWIKTLDNILKLDADTIIPGHGPVMKKEDIQTWKGKFQTLQTRVTELVRQGVKKEEVASKLKTDDLNWPLQPNSNFVQRSLPAFYDEMAARR